MTPQLNEMPDRLEPLLYPPPLARLLTGGTAKPWHVLDGASYRPGYALTPERLWSIFRAAEVGQPAMQCDMFEDLEENDGHMRGQYESRLSSVAFRPWILQAGAPDAASKAAAQALGAALKRTNMLSCLWHMMEAFGYGWSGINIAWAYDPILNINKPARFLCAPHRRFVTLEASTGELRFLTPEDSAQGVPLLRGEWIIPLRPHRKTMRAGIFRTCAWWCLFKRMSIRDWMVFAERFGIPIVMGSYSAKASPESRMALLQAVQDVGTDGQAVLEDTTKIVVDNTVLRNGDLGSLHPTIAAKCDAEISKVITGATLNVESGGPGSFALGKVHEGRATSLSFSDAYWIQEVFGEAVCQSFIDYNPKFAGATAPQLKIRVQPEMSPVDRIKVLSIAQVMGYPIEDEQLSEDLGLRTPSLGVVLKPLYAPPPTPTAIAPKTGPDN